MRKYLKNKVLYLFSGYFSKLLVFLFLLFVFRPYDQGAIYTAIWEFLFAAVFVSAIFDAHHPKLIRIICIALAIPALLLDWTLLMFSNEAIAVGSLTCTLLFMLVCTGSILYNVVLKARVSMETLRGVICAYFMIGFAFAFAFVIIEYIHPGSFHMIDELKNLSSQRIQFFSQMVYFSFVTLLTIGFGDISAIANVSQTCTIIEGIFGQFYIAILVSRLVAVYAFASGRIGKKN